MGVQGSVLVERMVEIEEERKKLKKYAESMELKYSQAFGRKNEYKDKYLESERSHISYKKETIETIKKCKEETETEKNMKLKLIIDNHKQDKFAVELEQKVDNLMKEYEILRKSHEEKNRLLIRNHDNELKKERSQT